MAKRKSSDGEALNLDSLMDALTNVVAVLILVLLLVNADATNTIIKYFTDLEPATPEQVQQSQAKVDELIKQKEQVQQIFQQEPPKPDEIEAAKQRIRTLEMDIKIQQKDIKTMSDLQKELEVAETNRDKEKSIVVALQDEIAKIKSQLDTTEVEEPKDNVLQDIQIPEMKDIPPNSNTYYIYVAGSKLSLLNQQKILDEIEKEWVSNKKDLFVEKIKPDKKYIDVYDLAKARSFMGGLIPKLKSNTFGFNIQSIIVEYSHRVILHFFQDPQKGMDISELEKPQNIFLDELRKIGADRNAVLFFRVNDNDPKAFITYDKARKFVEQKYPRMPVGFNITANRGHGKNDTFVPVALDESVFRVKPTGTPPPRPKTTPTPPKAPTPPPLKDKLG